jgi:hypothetical protein
MVDDPILVRVGESESWVTQVFEYCRNRCSNCGGEDRLRVKLGVPEEAGGKRVLSNAFLICRPCEMASEIISHSSSPASGNLTRPINFWVSRTLYDHVQNGLSRQYGFKSVSSLVRFLMSKYVTDADLFDDVTQYQDDGADVKLNVWISKDIYATFKSLVDKNGLTVTGALKGLLRMYEIEADKVTGRTAK